MEELQPQDIEDLLQELEEAGETQEPLPPEVEELLDMLQAGSLDLARRNAAQQLGKLGTSNARIVRALIYAYESDPVEFVSLAAAEALRAPVHQQYLHRHPDLMESTASALKRRPGADKQRYRLDTKGVLPLLGALSPVLAYEVGILVGSYLSRSMHAFPYSLFEQVYGQYLSLNLICSMPALAFGLFLRWLAVRTAQEKKWSAVIVFILVCLCTIFTLAVGFGVGMFMNLDLSRY